MNRRPTKAFMINTEHTKEPYLDYICVSDKNDEEYIEIVKKECACSDFCIQHEGLCQCGVE